MSNSNECSSYARFPLPYIEFVKTRETNPLQQLTLDLNLSFFSFEQFLGQVAHAANLTDTLELLTHVTEILVDLFAAFHGCLQSGAEQIQGLIKFAENTRRMKRRGI